MRTKSLAGRQGWQSELPEHVDHWVKAGIVTTDQAAAITTCEGIEPAEQPQAQGYRAPRLTPLAEAISYLGVILMTASGALITARFWKDLHVGGRLAIGLVMILAGFGAAALVARIGDDGSRRVASFLQLFGTGGVAFTAGVIAAALGGRDAGVTALAIGAPVLVVSVALWRNRERVLPFLSAIAGAAVGAAGLYSVAGWDLTTTEKALPVWAVAMGLGVLAAGKWLHPTLPGLLVAEVAALTAALLVVNPHHALGLVLGLITALGALLAGMALKHNSVQAVSVIGCLVFLGYTLALFVKGPAAAVAILVLGAVLVALAIRAGLHRKNSPPSPGRRFQ